MNKTIGVAAVAAVVGAFGGGAIAGSTEAEMPTPITTVNTVSIQKASVRLTDGGTKTTTSANICGTVSYAKSDGGVNVSPKCTSAVLAADLQKALLDFADPALARSVK